MIEPGSFTATKPSSANCEPMKNLNLSATITVGWNNEMHSLTLTPSDWETVKSGQSHSRAGDGYYYEGKVFQDFWSFAGGLNGELEVTYGDDGGQGFIGRLSDAVIQEHEYTAAG